MKDRIYRIETSNDEHRLVWDSFPKLHYFSEMDKNEPELLLRCLWPKKDELIVSIISLEGMLMLSNFRARMRSMSSRCWWAVVKVQKRSTTTIARLKMSVR